MHKFSQPGAAVRSTVFFVMLTTYRHNTVESMLLKSGVKLDAIGKFHSWLAPHSPRNVPSLKSSHPAEYNVINSSFASLDGTAKESSIGTPSCANGVWISNAFEGPSMTVGEEEPSRGIM